MNRLFEPFNPREIDPSLLMTFNKTNFKANIKIALMKGLRGKSILKGDGELKRLWSRYEDKARRDGLAGAIMKGGKMLVVDCFTTEINEEGKEVKNYLISKNSFKEYTTITIKEKEVIEGKPTGKVIDKTYYASRKQAELLGGDEESLFAVLENDLDLSPSLLGIDEDLDNYEKIMEAIMHEVEASKKRVYFIFPQKPNPKEWISALEMWKNGVMGYIVVEETIKANPKKGQSGMDPNSIDLKVYQPENKGRDLWVDLEKIWKKILWKCGVRFDMLQDKEERAGEKEVEQSTYYFDCIEREEKGCRIDFIEWCRDNWGNDAIKSDYSLSYGQV